MIIQAFIITVIEPRNLKELSWRSHRGDAQRLWDPALPVFELFLIFLSWLWSL